MQDTPSYNNTESESDSKSIHSNSNGNGLPPFSSFSASDVAEGLGGRLAADGYLSNDGISSTRIMELSGISGLCVLFGYFLVADCLKFVNGSNFVLMGAFCEIGKRGSNSQNPLKYDRLV